jgi:hypothetical protein
MVGSIYFLFFICNSIYACEELLFCESGVVKIVHIRLIKLIDY